jgi:hypothetical protein
MNKLASTSLAVVFVLAVGCKGKDKDKDPPPERQSKAATVPAPAPIAAPPVTAPPAPRDEPLEPLEVDPEVAKLVKAIVANCKVTEASYDRLNECKAGELDAVGTYVKGKKAPDFFGSLAEILLKDGAKDKKTYWAVVKVIDASYSSGHWTNALWKANASPAAAKRYVKIMATIDDTAPANFANVTTALALNAGLYKELAVALSKHKAGSELRTAAIPHYLDYGIAGLPYVQEFAKSADASERHAAAWSVGVAMYDHFRDTSSPDAKQMCDWAKSLLSDAQPAGANGAAESMSRCGGTYIDAALEALDVRVAKEQIDNALGEAIKEQCASSAQCTKAIDLLEKATKRADLSKEALSTLIWVIESVGTHAPSDATEVRRKAKALLEELAKNKDSTVGGDAKKRLESFK